MEKHFKGDLKQPAKMVLYVGIALLIIAIIWRFYQRNPINKANIITSSELTDIIDISELSTAEFKYNGIAEKKNKKGKIWCRICYSAIVKAGIDLKKVKIDVDNEKKIIIISLPKIGINVSMVDDQSMTVLPSDANIEIDEMLKCCMNDAEKEASSSKTLKDTAYDNLISSIKGLLFPIIKGKNYTLQFR